MSQYYYNLVEDEKEARKEKYGIRIATVLIILGVLLFGYNYFKKENN